MAENSKIAWTNHTFNPWIGCSRVSEGCENCYAENLMDRRYRKVEWGPGKPRSRTKTWNDPVKWEREAARSGIRAKVFCASLADFLDHEIPAQWREDLFDLIERCPHLDWLMLTKRIESAATMLPPKWIDNPPPHVWLGVTAENQRWYDRRLPVLMSTPAALRWVSYEPALGPLLIKHNFDWLIIGGESAQLEPARPFDVKWAISAVTQCRGLGIRPFVKQLGTNVHDSEVMAWPDSWPNGRRIELQGDGFGDHLVTGLKDKAGADPSEWPAVLRVRQFPEVLTV